jgi:hypothetical protein
VTTGRTLRFSGNARLIDLLQEPSDFAKTDTLANAMGFTPILAMIQDLRAVCGSPLRFVACTVGNSVLLRKKAP